MRENAEKGPRSGPVRIGIGSGKGGTGKSTMTVNIGIEAARRGYRVGLIDMDPLSNLAVVLDIPRETIESMPETLESRLLRNYRVPALPRLDILFPRAKVRKGQTAALRDRVFNTFTQQFEALYDILLLDLPAGIDEEENLLVLPELDSLVVVVNPEPTSHVSAGGYIRAALDKNAGLKILLWHNRFSPGAIDPSFNARDVVANYNRFVEHEFQIDERECSRFRHIAWVPTDPALSLLGSEPDFSTQIVTRIEENCRLLVELLTREPQSTDFPSAPTVFRRLVRYSLLYTGSEPAIDAVRSYLTSIAGESSIFESPVFTKALERYRAKIVGDPRRSAVFGVLAASEAYAGESEGIQKTVRLRTLGKRIIECLLRTRSYTDAVPAGTALTSTVLPMEKNSYSLLLYYRTILQLLESRAFRQAILGLVPFRKGSAGTVGRDSPVFNRRNRNRQIRSLVAEDGQIESLYTKTLDRLYPLVEKQLILNAKTFALARFLFIVRESEKTVLNRDAYRKLTGRVLFDFMYAGLGVTTGLKDSPSSREISKGVDGLVEAMGVPFH